MDNISDMTGASQYKRPASLKTNEIRFNGKNGKFSYVNLLGRKEGEKAESKDLGTSLKLVFLKIRRKMSYYHAEKEVFVVTSEHNSKEDTVFLFGPNVKGVASELREKYEQLRTQQVVYVAYEAEIVRLIVKGASLGSQVKAKTTTAFFEYLQDYKGEDHVHEHYTEISSVEEEGKLGSYMVMDFKRGKKLTKAGITSAEDRIKEIHEVTSATDEYYNKKTGTEVTKEVKEEKEKKVDTVEYPDDEINLDDIPF